MLYAPWVLTAAAYPSAWTNEHGDVPRRTSLTVDEFRDVYEHPNTPVIVTDWTDGWSAHERWVPDALERTHGDALLEIFDDYAGPVAIPLSAYLQYGRALRWFRHRIRAHTALLRLQHGAVPMNARCIYLIVGFVKIIPS